MVEYGRTNYVIDRLYGILEGTEISSYQFAEDKKQEKELEEEKLARNKVQ